LEAELFHPSDFPEPVEAEPLLVQATLAGVISELRSLDELVPDNGAWKQRVRRALRDLVAANETAAALTWEPGRDGRIDLENVP
jgi:hypothetical protein